uniref:Uncharacterized protein n=1 Tax=Acrobeloides nanus TaxID=290746 RepID=A0A914C925_9BILA
MRILRSMLFYSLVELPPPPQRDENYQYPRKEQNREEERRRPPQRLNHSIRNPPRKEVIGRKYTNSSRRTFERSYFPRTDYGYDPKRSPLSSSSFHVLTCRSFG